VPRPGLERLAIDGGRPVRSSPYDSSRGIGAIGRPEIDAVTAVLEERSLFRYGHGPSLRKVDAFEAMLRRLFGVAHALAVSSGTAALQAGLVALGVEEGDEVVVPATTFLATAAAVVSVRAVPVFADVDETLNLDPAALEAAISDRTVAVVPVHLANVPADMAGILAVARRHRIRVLEDAAQACGVRYRGAMVGSIGDVGCLSFQRSKNITAGEGGAVLTHQWAAFDRALRYHDLGGQFTTTTGSDRRHGSGPPFLGVNLRMTEIAGAILEVQLGRLAGDLRRCRLVAGRLRAALAGLPVRWRPSPDPAGDGGDASFYLDDAAAAADFAVALRAEGIGAGRLFNGKVVYDNPALAARRTAWTRGCPFNCSQHPTSRRYGRGLCPRAEDLLPRMVSLDVGPRMRERDCEDVAAAVAKVAGHLLQDGRPRRRRRPPVEDR
jgi:8-amino-3,8-dideoxy-alpha-D-manno-octulosonate transaminase